MWILMLLLAFPSSAWAGDLAVGGALSGMGQGLGNGLNTMQGIMGQAALQEERERHERWKIEYQEWLREDAQFRAEYQEIERQRQLLRSEGQELERRRQLLERKIKDYNDRLTIHKAEKP